MYLHSHPNKTSPLFIFYSDSTNNLAYLIAYIFSHRDCHNRYRTSWTYTQIITFSNFKSPTRPSWSYLCSNTKCFIEAPWLAKKKEIYITLVLKNEECFMIPQVSNLKTIIASPHLFKWSCHCIHI